MCMSQPGLWRSLELASLCKSFPQSHSPSRGSKTLTFVTSSFWGLFQSSWLVRGWAKQIIVATAAVLLPMSSQVHKHYRLLLTIPQKWPRFGFLVYGSQGFRGKIPIQNHENRHQQFKGSSKLPKSSDSWLDGNFVVFFFCWKSAIEWCFSLS